MARVSRSQTVDQHWFAISDSEIDQPLADYLTAEAALFFRGDEQDVLGRFHQTLQQCAAVPDDIVIRLTGDCPLVCPELIDLVVKTHLAHNPAGYSHLHLAEFPRGFDVEVFSVAMLTTAFHEAQTPAEREHVTMYFYQQNRYPLLPVKGGDRLWSQFRLCVDEAADLVVIAALASHMGDGLMRASGAEICDVLVREPAISQINRHVQQKSHL
jgi:spore coat polysaccharide biosynthesis protein SpsF